MASASGPSSGGTGKLPSRKGRSKRGKWPWEKHMSLRLSLTAGCAGTFAKWEGGPNKYERE
jgi:hypothetical protein